MDTRSKNLDLGLWNEYKAQHKGQFDATSYYFYEGLTWCQRIDNLNLIETWWKNTTFGHQALIPMWHSVTLENPRTKP